MHKPALLLLHPQCRLLLLFVLAILLPLQPLAGLLLCQLLLLFFCWRQAQLRNWLTAVLRLKWLLLSIAVLYGWFTPGLPIFEMVGVNLPSREGLILALQRSLLLSSLVATVMWLVKPLPAPTVAAALTRLLMPLTVFSIDVDTFARRLALTLATVPSLQGQLKTAQQRGWLAAAGNTLLHIESGQLKLEATTDKVNAELKPVMADDCLRLILLLALFILPWLLMHFCANGLLE